MYRIALILALALFAASCGGRRSRPQQTACVSQPRVFLFHLQEPFPPLYVLQQMPSNFLLYTRLL